MNTPRFTVGSVTGYHVPNETITLTKLGSNTKPQTIWYVHDSAYGYQICAEYKGPVAEEQARARAAELNEEPYKPPRKRRKPSTDHLTVYLDYPVLVTPQGFDVHGCHFKSFAAVRNHIRQLRRQKRIV